MRTRWCSLSLGLTARERLCQMSSPGPGGYEPVTLPESGRGVQGARNQLLEHQSALQQEVATLRALLAKKQTLREIARICN